MNEFILCAAIWVNDNKTHDEQPENIESGFIVCGRRHGDCYQTIKSISSVSANDTIGDLLLSMNESEQRKHQGFITSAKRYVDRKEAWKIALKNNQIKIGLKASDNGEESILISENLY